MPQFEAEEELPQVFEGVEAEDEELLQLLFEEEEEEGFPQVFEGVEEEEAELPQLFGRPEEEEELSPQLLEPLD